MFKSLKQNIKQRPTKFLVLILALIIPVLFFTRQKENTNQTTNKTLLPPPDISINSSITTPKRSISNLNQSLPNYAPITPLQPTNSKIIELKKIAHVSKFKTYKISKKEQIRKIFSKIKNENGPICVLVKIEKSDERSIRVDISPPNIKSRFMKSLK